MEANAILQHQIDALNADLVGFNEKMNSMTMRASIKKEEELELKTVDFPI